MRVGAGRSRRRPWGPSGVLLHRRYEFNDTDLEVSLHWLHMFLDEKEEIPWESLRYAVPIRPLLKENPPPPGVGGGGGRRPKKSLCIQNRPQLSGPFNELHFLPEENCSDVGGGGGVRPGLARAPNDPRGSS